MKILVRRMFPFLLLCGPGCVIGGRDQLLGFPDIRSDTPSEMADRAQDVVRATERLLLSHSAGDDADALWRRSAWLRLLDSYVALSNDEVGASTGLDPQGSITRRPPLYLYPRVTSPLLAEPSDELRAWIHPVILNRRAFERPRRVDAWLGTPLASLLFSAKEHELEQWGLPLYEKLRRHFGFPKHGANIGEQIFIAELPDGEVHGHAHRRQSLALPGDVLRARLF